MGLFSDKHYHSHRDGDTIIKFPDTIKVHEHKAPTDESIRLADEFYEKALKSIIAKGRVDDNLLTGQCWLVNNPIYAENIRLYVRFKINDKEFTVEKSYRDFEFYKDIDSASIYELQQRMKSEANAIMLWYCLKYFASIAYEQMTGTQFDQRFLQASIK